MLKPNNKMWLRSMCGFLCFLLVVLIDFIFVGCVSESLISDPFVSHRPIVGSLMFVSVFVLVGYLAYLVRTNFEFRNMIGARSRSCRAIELVMLQDASSPSLLAAIASYRNARAPVDFINHGSTAIALLFLILASAAPFVLIRDERSAGLVLLAWGCIIAPVAVFISCRSLYWEYRLWTLWGEKNACSVKYGQSLCIARGTACVLLCPTGLCIWPFIFLSSSDLRHSLEAAVLMVSLIAFLLPQPLIMHAIGRTRVWKEGVTEGDESSSVKP